MKFLITSLAFVGFLSINAFAQSDSLVIKLKSNQIDKIPMSQIQSLRFENLTDVEEYDIINSNLKIGTNFPNPFSVQKHLAQGKSRAGRHLRRILSRCPVPFDPRIQETLGFSAKERTTPSGRRTQNQLS